MRRIGWGVCVVAAAVLAASAGAGAVPRASGCAPTAPDGFGPFGRGMPPVRSSIGRGHVLIGVVLSALGCRPVSHAAVQLWQSNRNGVYTRAGSATVFTDASGRFRFQGPFPTAYEGLPPHIHIRVSAPNYVTLLARYVPAPRERSGSIRLVLKPAEL